MLESSHTHMRYSTSRVVDCHGVNRF